MGESSRKNAAARVPLERVLARVRALLGTESRRAADSLDFVQAAWLSFLRAPSAAETWDDDVVLRKLTAIARNDIRDAGRRRRVAALESLGDAALAADALARDESSATTRIARRELAQRARAAALALDPQLKAIVVWRAIEGQSFVEIAARLGRAEDAVRKSYNRALLHLGRRLEVRGE